MARWLVGALERGASGTAQVTGPVAPLTMGELVEACEREAGVACEPVWRPDEFLVEKGAGPWMELPLWLPESDPSHRGFMAADLTRAVSLGLACRPLAETVRDTLAWARTRPSDHAWKTGPSAEREAAWLAAS